MSIKRPRDDIFLERLPYAEQSRGWSRLREFDMIQQYGTEVVRSWEQPGSFALTFLQAYY